MITETLDFFLDRRSDLFCNKLKEGLGRVKGTVTPSTLESIVNFLSEDTQISEFGSLIDELKSEPY